jgi:hypothetical protein
MDRCRHPSHGGDSRLTVGSLAAKIDAAAGSNRLGLRENLAGWSRL